MAGSIFGRIDNALMEARLQEEPRFLFTEMSQAEADIVVRLIGISFYKDDHVDIRDIESEKKARRFTRNDEGSTDSLLNYKYYPEAKILEMLFLSEDMDWIEEFLDKMRNCMFSEEARKVISYKLPEKKKPVECYEYLCADEKSAAVLWYCMELVSLAHGYRGAIFAELKGSERKSAVMIKKSVLDVIQEIESPNISEDKLKAALKKLFASRGSHSR